MLRDSDSDVRKAATIALAQLERTDAIDDIVEAIKAEKNEAVMQREMKKLKLVIE